MCRKIRIQRREDGYGCVLHLKAYIPLYASNTCLRELDGRCLVKEYNIKYLGLLEYIFRAIEMIIGSIKEKINDHVFKKSHTINYTWI